MEILLISGLSGSGKSKAASFLEDMGFYIVDNMPAGMILKFAEFCAGGNGRYDRVALVYDVRTADSFTELFEVLDQLKKKFTDKEKLMPPRPPLPHPETGRASPPAWAPWRR